MYHITCKLTQSFHNILNDKSVQIQFLLEVNYPCIKWSQWMVLSASCKVAGIICGVGYYMHISLFGTLQSFLLWLRWIPLMTTWCMVAILMKINILLLPPGAWLRGRSTCVQGLGECYGWSRFKTGLWSLLKKRKKKARKISYAFDIL